MEGPTPVSALIHAATMVAAGVYLVTRSLPLFTPESLQIVLGIGLLTHLAAGTVALTMTDIKRILAYSTISQLGLMMVALGLGAGAAAMFHLYTHAFFKALLFLGAGSVIHATHQQELAALGGLRRAMPWTAAVMLIAALSMSGLPFLSGFWSKDAILLAAQQAHPGLLWLLLLGAILTAGYVARLYLRCFHGLSAAPHGKHQPHESPVVMVAPMVVLAFGALGAGLAGSPVMHHQFFHVLGAAQAHEGIDVPIVLLSSAAALIGIWLAWIVGVRRRKLLPVGLQPLGARLYQLAAHKYYVDELYGRIIIQPFLSSTRALAAFDFNIVDGLVNGAGRMGWNVGQWKGWFDQAVVDRAVNAFASAIRDAGRWARRLQTGIIQEYLLVVVVAAVALAVVIQW
jgi:NADH-quinone oxidoreductase subunit L